MIVSPAHRRTGSKRPEAALEVAAEGEDTLAAGPEDAQTLVEEATLVEAVGTGEEAAVEVEEATPAVGAEVAMVAMVVVAKASLVAVVAHSLVVANRLLARIGFEAIALMALGANSFMKIRDEKIEDPMGIGIEKTVATEVEVEVEVVGEAQKLAVIFNEENALMGAGADSVTKRENQHQYKKNRHV